MQCQSDSTVSYTSYKLQGQSLSENPVNKVFIIKEIAGLIFSFLPVECGLINSRNSLSRTNKFFLKISDEHTLHCKIRDWKEIGVEEVKIIFNRFTNLTSLGYYHFLTDAMLGDCLKLQTVILNLGISDEGLKPLINLTKLDLTYNEKVSNQGLKSLANLTILILGYNKNINDEVLIPLTHLTALNLSANNTISDNGIKSLMTTLDLSSNSVISDEGLVPLTRVTTLHLSGNKIISDDGIKFLTNLTTLDLCYNDEISNQGLKFLTNLTTLALQGNAKISDEGLKFLTNLTTLNLYQNKKISKEGLKPLINLVTIYVNEFNELYHRAEGGFIHLEGRKISVKYS